jgi:hypothetical protein
VFLVAADFQDALAIGVDFHAAAGAAVATD